jgi:hypothetical protein
MLGFRIFDPGDAWNDIPPFYSWTLDGFKKRSNHGNDDKGVLK